MSIRLPGDAVEIEIDPFVPSPDEPRLWIEQRMAQDTPFGAKLRDVTPIVTRNELGWPMEMTSATVVDLDGKVVEGRIGAFYKFQEWAVSAVARSADLAALDAARGTIVETFASGKPEFKHPMIVAAISQLWE